MLWLTKENYPQEKMTQTIYRVIQSICEYIGQQTITTSDSHNSDLGQVYIQQMWSG